MKFKYLKFPLVQKSAFFGSSIIRPIIPIEISYRGKSLRYAALIDSGADFCIFDGEVGDYLGIEIQSGMLEEFGGIQERGESEAFLHTITIKIGGWDYSNRKIKCQI